MVVHTQRWSAEMADECFLKTCLALVVASQSVSTRWVQRVVGVEMLIEHGI